MRPQLAVGGSGDQRRRLIRHHLPIAIGCAIALALFLVLPTFDPRAYPRTDMSGALPRPAADHATPEPVPSASPRPDHGTAPTPGARHEADRSAAPGHGASTSSPGHGSIPSPAAEHEARVESTDPRLTTARLTTATGYVATGLLGLTLVIGPTNLLFRRRNPVSSYLRRDAGMWTAAFSVVHVIFGAQVHGGGGLAGIGGYFFARDGTPLVDSFGLGNWTGLGATLIVVGLLAISSDAALGSLKAGRWKWLQRLNYALFALVLVHAFFYGALVRAESPFTRLLLITAILVTAAQTVGIWLWRRRRARALRLSAGPGSASSDRSRPAGS